MASRDALTANRKDFFELSLGFDLCPSGADHVKSAGVAVLVGKCRSYLDGLVFQKTGRSVQESE